jgi:hypothetical protein
MPPGLDGTLGFDGILAPDLGKTWYKTIDLTHKKAILGVSVYHLDDRAPCCVLPKMFDLK